MAVLGQLLRHHQRLGDKVLVFSDNTAALRKIARKFELPFMEGRTSAAERRALLCLFKTSGAAECSVLCLSKVGDVALDLPDANVLIQISSQGGSRMQEVQRLGRVGRQKLSRRAKAKGSVFYSLLSEGTAECDQAAHRAAYVEQMMGLTRLEVDVRKLGEILEQEMESEMEMEMETEMEMDVDVDKDIGGEEMDEDED
jgi:superfamily II DNA or RNA helicase